MPGIQELTRTTLTAQLKRVVNDLHRKYGHRAERARIATAVQQEAARYAHARVTQYVPTLVQHAVDEQLRKHTKPDLGYADTAGDQDRRGPSKPASH